MAAVKCVQNAALQRSLHAPVTNFECPVLLCRRTKRTLSVIGLHRSHAGAEGSMLDIDVQESPVLQYRNAGAAHRHKDTAKMCKLTS